MLGIGTTELLVIALIALLLFGKEDLPATLRKVTKGWNEFRKVANDAQRSWTEVRDDVARSIMIEDQKIQLALNGEPATAVPQAPDSAQTHESASDAQHIATEATEAPEAIEPGEKGPSSAPLESHSETSPAALQVQQPVIRAPEGQLVPQGAEPSDQHHNNNQERSAESAASPAPTAKDPTVS